MRWFAGAERAERSDKATGRNGLQPALVAGSILYVLAVIGLPAITNLGLCHRATICGLLPTTRLTEFDKWGSYLAGALVPLSLIWVAFAFRLQNRQLVEQAAQQARSLEIAFQAQRIADRQALSALSPTYLERMDKGLRDLAEFMNSNLDPSTTGGFRGRVPDAEVASSMSGVAQVFTSYHNLLVAAARSELSADELHGLKSLFVDSDMSDYLTFFFGPYNEFHTRCGELDCLILIPPNVQSMADSLKWNFLRSTWRWHPDEQERIRLARLVGWSDQELAARFAEHPDEASWEPFGAG